MGWFNVLRKDCREHGLSLLALATGLIAIVLLSAAQQQAAEFSMSSFEVVRFALITVIPLIILIVGNRLIVREYTLGTRLFMESLPIRPATPVVVKLLSGWLYLLLLGTVLVSIAAMLANTAEFIDRRYMMLLLVKTSAIITVYWAIVFFTSFTGKLRLPIYLLIGFVLLMLFDLPNFDETRLAPVALLDHQLFIFERENFPWRDLIETLAISLAFVAGGFTLALINEGSVAEQLGKPLNRRNFAAIALLALGTFSVYQNLQQKWDSSDTEFSGDTVLREASPSIAISYLTPSRLPQAELIRANLKRVLEKFQAETALATLPRVQIALNSNLNRTEIYPVYNDGGVEITANFSDYNDYEHGTMNTMTMHHLMLKLTNGRWDYESRHWILDGLARWWAEGADKAIESPANPELFTRALHAQRLFTSENYTSRLPASNSNPLLAWESMTDDFGFEAVEALAYTALLYLAEQTDVDTLVRLTTDYLQEKPRASSLESINRLLNPDNKRFQRITGIEFEQFTTDWFAWLRPHQNDPSVSQLLDLIPAITGNASSVADDNNVYWLEVHYQPIESTVTHGSLTESSETNNNRATGNVESNTKITGQCVLRHQRTSAYDIETEVSVKVRDRQPCVINQTAHRIEVPYSDGDRAYVKLEYEHERFARPVPLWTGRVSFQ